MELNDRIIQARKQAGLTQEQLGEKLGVSRQAVSKWESGQANPDVSYIVEMCRLFDVSSDWLLLGWNTSDRDGETKVCPQCGHPASEHDCFCAQCGASLAENNLLGRCPSCGTQLSGESTYCTKCGKHLNDTYALYLLATNHDEEHVAELLYQLLLNDWIVPSFPCDEITMDVAKLLAQNPAPQVLCQGLTYEEALKSTKYFSELPGVIKIYRDSDIVIDSGGVLRPTAPSVSIASPSNEKDEPLSGFAIFGLVVLGVIVAILLMSIF